MKNRVQLMVLLLSTSLCLQIALKQPTTCFYFMSGDGDELRELYFNYDIGRNLSVRIQ